MNGVALISALTDEFRRKGTAGELVVAQDEETGEVFSFSGRVVTETGDCGTTTFVKLRSL